MENCQALNFKQPCEDAEVDTLLHSQNNEIDLVEDEEKPLSPVLSGTSVRKLIRGKKGNRKKSCKVKLSTKFEPPQVQNISNSTIPDFPEDSFSVSQADSLIDRIEKLEQIEKFRDKVYNALMLTCTRHDDSTFKKPLLPPLLLMQQTEICRQSKSRTPLQNEIKNPDLLTVTIEKTVPGCREEFDRIEIPNFGISLEKGFQTARGKNITFSEPQLNKHCHLFNDILTSCSSAQGVSVRPNKYNYIHKHSLEKKNDQFRNKKNNTLTEVKCVSNFSTNQQLQETPDSSSTFAVTITNSEVVDVFKGEDFSDLKFPHKKFLPKVNATNIFVDENLDDLHPQISFGGFKKVSDLKELNLICENIPDGKHIEPTENLRPIIQQTNNCPSKNKSNQSCSTSSAASNSLKNIFKDESFEDLNCNKKTCNFEGFKKASGVDKGCFKKDKGEAVSARGLELKVQRKQEKTKEPSQLSIADNRLKRSYKHVFADEDLSDLIPQNNQIMNFKSLPVDPRFCPPALKRPRNIFADEDFSDLKPFRNNLDNIKPLDAIEFKRTIARKDPKSIFDGEDFSDLNILNSGVKKVIAPTHFANAIENSPIPKIKSLKDTAPITSLNTSEVSLKEISLLAKFSKDIMGDFKGFSETEKVASRTISEFSSNISCELQKKLEILIENNQKCNIFNIIHLNEVFKKIYSNICNKLTSTTPYQNLKRKLPQLDIASLPLDKRRKNSDESLSDNTPKRVNLYSSEASAFLNSTTRRRKCLGTQFTPTIQVSQTKLDRARRLFDQDLSPKTFCTSTPIKNGNDLSNIYQNNNASSLRTNNVTPVRKVNSFCASNVSKNSSNISNSSVIERTVINKNSESSIRKNVCNVEDKRFVLETPTKGDSKDWIRELEIQRHALEEKLRFINKKQSLLNKQKFLLEENNEGQNKPNPGALYSTKCNNDGRISLRKFVEDAKCSRDKICNQFLWSVNVQNAEKVHFVVDNKSQVSIITKDGAVIIPNAHSAVGFAEFEHAFKVMPGVDPKLIPKNWIKNHFRWIIWKLASYERMFPKKFEGVFNLENVIQQLKYRYDREIDKAERPALRKIMEKDDIPQKRMVLCVSDILKIDDRRYEIELTDGWYSIRTRIDRPLGNQIIKGKIKVGVKLITCGAELLNCDGCHPLEATDMVRLKISFNSTRRAIWDAKLGYQKDTRPFILPIESFVDDGGTIGCVRFYISRVYPVKYLEKIGDMKVWRNKKAEDRKSQEWQSDRIKVLEKIQDNIQKSYKSLNSSKSATKYIKISDIKDPQTLYEVLSNCKDPETFEESLTESQKSTLRSYHLNKSLEQQYEMDKKVKEQVADLRCRDVRPLLRIKIVDVMEKNEKQHYLHVWRPTEAHFQLFKEDHLFTAYNLSYNERWGLSSNMKSQFKLDGKPEDERFLKFRRKLALIKHLKDLDKFVEFDTVGLVIQVKVDDAVQQLWLSDCEKNLLVVNVYDSPKNILIFDTLKPGQVVAGCNLVFSECNSEAIIASGNHLTVFSSYSKYRHLQDAVEELEKDFPMDVDNFVKGCEEIVTNILSKYNYLMKVDTHSTTSELNVYDV